MKYVVIVFVFVLTSLTYAAPCIPNPSAFNRFLTTVLVEREYHGKGSTSYTTYGEETVYEIFSGHFSFRKRSANRISFGSTRCGSSECDQTDEYWEFSRGCMYINGRRVVFERVTPGELNFRYTVDDVRLNYSFRLIPGRRLDLSINRTSDESVSIVNFSGTGR